MEAETALEHPETRRVSAQHPPVRGIKRVIFSLIPVLLLCGAGEGAARIIYWRQHGHDWRYLTIPFGWKDKSPYGLKNLTVYPSVHKTKTLFDQLSQRELVFRVNSQGGRGGEWVQAKAPGTTRILAIGGSSTFGINNPEEATWPVLLKRELKSASGTDVEVLNGGRPGGMLGSQPGGADALDSQDLLKSLQGSNSWFQMRPDVVLYYEGYNNSPRPYLRRVDWAIARFHTAMWLGQWSRWLYYRSMLYTYLVEKWFFTWIRKQYPLSSAVTYYRAEVQELFHDIQAHGAKPVLVLQVLPYPDPAEIRQANLHDPQAVDALVNRLVDQHAGGQDVPIQEDFRSVYNAAVLIEVARREADAAGVQVIDPRPVFFSNGRLLEGLLHDHIHLTDRGNALLAQQIAAQLRLSSATQP